MNQVRLWGKPIRVNKASADKQKTLEVGAELFIGNLDPMVDEKVLFETFGRFGSLTSAPKVCCLVYKLQLSRDGMLTKTYRRLPVMRTTLARATALSPSPPLKHPTTQSQTCTANT